MFKLLREDKRLNETILMGVFTLFCFAFSIYRAFYVHSIVFLSLNWNLFLAFIPWALSSIAVLKPSLIKSRIAIVFLLFVWFLFFPNSPYILTDLVHLRMKSAMPIWFDLLLILSFAWTGMLFGFLSLWDIEKILANYLNRTWISIISSALLFLGSFGIYIGRYLRWNSWDIFKDPIELFNDIGDRMINPISNPRAWGMTLFMGFFLNMVYWSFSLIRKRQ